MELVGDFLTWAWPRHLNPVSWYIRPLFFLPIAYFCWTRRGWWLTVTIVAMISSFFWFPAPSDADTNPTIKAVLDMEEQLFTHPTWTTWVTLPLIPALLISLGAAFWHRSLGWGLIVINGGLALKILWTTANSGSDGFLATIAPLGAGMIIMTALVIGIAKWRGIPLGLARHNPGRTAESAIMDE